MTLPLACTVRDCAEPLARRGSAFVCPRGHAFDLGRSGYVNLLQPQDRRSLEPGDAKSIVDARARLLAQGIGRRVIESIVERVSTLPLDPGVVAELGSGTGDALAALHTARSILGVGIDLSRAAATHAARRFPALTWVVANADRRLPLLDRSVGLVLSLHARRNPIECARVLAPGGHLLVAVPGSTDLAELRALVQGAVVLRERGDTLGATHASLFAAVAQWTVGERRVLARAALLDLLRSTYRGARESAASRVDELGDLEVTFASDLFLFRRSESSAALAGDMPSQENAVSE
jgi:23S rRNA (guanine745-N1)-methyltransferase